ncbi:MAG TPA: zinc-ribbon domain-containing protein, partial [Archangium sp.]|nr:zinc-ribbon domain-containing protein [Archangium sp.]
MEIACPQCSMQYALDPRLLPPGGVPVQCTRCSHVFIATPPAPASAPAPQTTQVFGAVQQKGPATQPNLNSTLLYGDKKGGTPPSAMTTQAFGAVPQVAPMAPVAKPAPATGTAPSAMTTQVFGAVPQVAPMAPVAKPAPAAAKPPPAAAKPPPAAKPPAGTVPPIATGTQVFGAV